MMPCNNKTRHELTHPCRRTRHERRSRFSLINLRHLGFQARRQKARRADGLQNYYVDWYQEPHLLFFSLSIVIMSAIDGMLTMVLLDKGMVVEVNPIMAALMEKGMMYFFNMKYILTSLCVFFLVIHKNFILLGSIKIMHLLALVSSAFLLLNIYEVVLLYAHPM